MDSSFDARPEAGTCLTQLPEGLDAGYSPWQNHYTCRNGFAYTYTSDEEFQGCWLYSPDIECPLWSEDECETALEQFHEPQPCSLDDDCVLWGGLSNEGACEVSAGPPAVSVSLLLRPDERDAFQDAYDALVRHGCVQEWGLDSTPHVATCDAGQCKVWQGSCLD